MNAGAGDAVTAASRALWVDRSADAGPRIAYFGTPQVAVAPLRALCDAGFDVSLVVTRPPKRRGRNQPPSPSPVDAAARELDIAVAFDADDARLADMDLGIMVAYGELIPERVLASLRIVNLHFSLLPRWRGPAPIERAILAGDAETGVCLMDVASELDTGAVYRRASLSLTGQESAQELRARLCEQGIAMLLDALANGFSDASPQSGNVIWADKITSEELRIDWRAPSESILRLVRVGGAWTRFKGRRLKILAAKLIAESAAASRHESDDRLDGSAEAPGTMTFDAAARSLAVTTGDGCIEVLQLQSEGRVALDASDWHRGARVVAGERLGA